MLLSYIMAVVIICLLMAAWTLVQVYWKKSFPEYSNGDEDVLALRGGCQDCKCKLVCKKKLFEAVRPNGKPRKN